MEDTTLEIVVDEGLDMGQFPRTESFKRGFLDLASELLRKLEPHTPDEVLQL